MCIAVYKPAKQKVPSNEIFQNCFDNNSHGAGYMFAYNGKVHIEKGFMTFKDFKKSLKKTLKKYGGNNRGFDLPMVFHFRITSQGGIEQSLTHPFPISDSYADMKKLSITCDMALAHNGIIDATSSYTVKDHNDTMEFIKEIFYPLVGTNKKYYQNKGAMQVFDYILGGSRVVILDGHGHAELIGDWKIENGIYYSNSSYSYKKQSIFPKTTSSLRPYDSSYYYGGSRWNEYEGYDDDDSLPWEKDDYDSKDTKSNGYSYYTLLSDSQINKLYADEELLCGFCGGDLMLEYDEDLDTYIAYCPDCGEVYMVDEDTAEFIIAHGLGGIETEETK